MDKLKKILPYILGAVILLLILGYVFQASAYKGSLKAERKKQQRSQEIIDSVDKENVKLLSDFKILDQRDDSMAAYIVELQNQKDAIRKYYQKKRDAVNNFTDDDIMRYFTNGN